jgi:hypothetical protein
MQRSRLGTLLTLIGAPLLILGLFFVAARAVGAAPVKVTLEQCANGGANETNQCSTDPGGAIGWVTGNSNAQKSTYRIGQFIAYRFIFNSLTAGARYCGAFSWDVSENGKPSLDYVSTFSQTMTLADPTLGTSFVGQVGSPTDRTAIPPDPALAMTMQGFPLTGSQVPGTVNLWGGHFVDIPSLGLPLFYANQGQFGDLASGGSASTQSLEYCFLAEDSQVILSMAGHIARSADWGYLPRPSGSPYHMRYGSNTLYNAPRTGIKDFTEEIDGIVNHYNFGNIEVQLDVGEPTAITLQEVTATGGNNGFGAVMAIAGVLILVTGLYLTFRRRQAG